MDTSTKELLGTLKKTEWKARGTESLLWDCFLVLSKLHP